MRRSFLLGALGLLASGILVWLLVHWFNEYDYDAVLTEKDLYKARLKLEGGSQSREAEPVQWDRGRPVRLAIGTLGLRDSAQDAQLGDLLTAQLTRAKGFELVDRQSLGKVLRELEMSLGGLVRAKDAVRAGKLLRADWFLLGTTVAANGTNSVIARVVDARTGIMRDVGVFQVPKDLNALASGLGEFVRQCRQGSGERPARIYLALGTFEDLGVNNRQADLPERLRAYLTAAYQGSKVTMLERELAGALLNEVRLDLAGLTEQASNAPPARMQSAFWLVNGYFQSYETTNLEVELDLMINRFFGGMKRASFREPPGDALSRKVKAAIDKSIEEARYGLAPTRKREIVAQLEMARQLSRFDPNSLTWGGWWEAIGRRDEAHERHNREEAVRALETVLLLDPANREAKLYLGVFLRHFPFDRVDEARGYYREIIESPIQDRWSGPAREGLIESFPDRNRIGLAAWLQIGPGQAKWFEAAANQTANSSASAFYRQQADAIKTELVIGNKANPKSAQVAEERLCSEILSWEKQLRGGQADNVSDLPGIFNYVTAFGRNRESDAAKSLVEILPRLRREAPDLAPQLLVAVVSHQVDAKAPVVAEFEQSLDPWLAHPETLFSPRSFFSLLSGCALSWADRHTNYDLCRRILEANAKAAAGGLTPKLTAEQRLELAFACAGTGRWQQALDGFLTYSNRPLYIFMPGLWGRGSQVILTSRQVARCRKQLGMAVEADPREFELEQCCLYWGAFAADSAGLWLCGGDRLELLDFGLRTNLVAAFPPEIGSAGTCLCVTPGTVWIGTASAGILEFDRSMKSIHRYTAAEGLMMDSITSLCATPEDLWIGYGQGNTGGLGRMGLRTHRVTSFSRSLRGELGSARSLSSRNGLMLGPEETANEPTRQLVFGLTVDPSGDVWFITRQAVRRYRPSDNTWDAFPQPVGCQSLAANGEHLYAAEKPGDFRLTTGHSITSVGGVQLELIDFQDQIQAGLGLNMLNFRDGHWKSAPAAEGLPRASATAVTVAGKDVWVGGLGYIALLDPETGTVRKFSYVPSPQVDRIEVGGGFVWVQAAQRLFRAPLTALGLSGS